MEKNSKSQTVSVIVPVYNVQGYLPTCIESILGQTHQGLEIIFINDGSSDDSLAVLQKYKELDNRINIISQRNQGVSAARNRGLSVASGEFIAFVDADDVLVAGYIEHLLKALKDNHADVAMCSYATIEDSQLVMPKEFQGDSADAIIYNSEQVLREVLYGNIVDSGPFCKLYRVDSIKDTLYDEKLTIGEDLSFFVDVFTRSDLKSVCINRRLYYYRTRESSAMTNSYSVKYFEYLNLVNDLGSKLVGAHEGFEAAVAYRKFGVASFCIGKMGHKYREFITDYDYCNRVLKQNSTIVLKSGRSSIKNRLLALGYLISPRLTSWVRCSVINRVE